MCFCPKCQTAVCTCVLIACVEATGGNSAFVWDCGTIFRGIHSHLTLVAGGLCLCVNGFRQLDTDKIYLILNRFRRIRT